MKLFLLSPVLVLLSIFGSNFGNELNKPPIDDGADAVIIWGGIKAEGGKIVNSKQADLTAALEKPIAVTLSGKEGKLESATVNIYPYSGDPILVYLIGDTFSADNIKEIQPKIGWGSKVFFENVTVSVKGKTKNLSETFSLKLI